MAHPLTKEKDLEIRARLERKEPVRTIARAMGISRAAVRARVPERVRKADEFATPVPRRAPRRSRGEHCWDLEKIVLARDAQMRGDFGPAVRLARAIRTDDAAYVAYHNRIAPQNSIDATLVPAPGARGEAVAKKAARSIIVSRATLAGIVGTLADHSIAIGYIDRETNDEGTRVNMRMSEWPLEFVKWNESREVLETQVRDAPRADIVHGDGEWIVFRKFDLDPWTQEAAVLPGALLWASHSGAVQNWNAGSKSHGSAKVAGELQEGVPLADENGTLHPRAESFLNMLQDLVEGEAGAGLNEHGSKIQVLYNGSSAWQIYEQLVLRGEKSFARIYLGTDAILGSVGGAPGLDIEALFKVASGKIQGDFLALQEGLRTGLYEPWTAINEGDSSRAPSLVYEFPDRDKEIRSADADAKLARLHGEIERRKKNGMIVTQEVVAELAKLFGVRNAPRLAEATSVAVPLDIAPTDAVKVFKSKEIRMAKGLAPFGDERDEKTIPQIDSDEAAKKKQEEIAAQAAADAATAAQSPPALATRAAGTYDESKHPRADDGKFGTGPGSSGGSEGDGPKDNDDTPAKARDEAYVLTQDFKTADDQLTARSEEADDDE